MCTVSIVPLERGFRLACNRDEQVNRPRAMPPRVRSIDSVRAMWPLDPLSNGTWIGVNEVGLTACLLNRHAAGQPPSPRGVISRGAIIPSLLRVRNLRSAVWAALSLRAASFQPFTLLLLQSGTLARVTNDSDKLRVRTGVLERPMVFTSSSLGDEQVLAPRRALFARMVACSAYPLAAQSAFHDHAWRHHPEISVRMRRTDAATLSQTTIAVDRAGIRICYRSLSE
jgi:uncharacterized protein with NRDE domain